MSTGEFVKRATRGFAWNHLYRIVDYGLYNLGSFAIVRYLGPVNASPFILYISIAMPLALVATLGIDGVLLRFLTRVSATGRDGDSNDLTTLPLDRFLLKMFSFRIFVTLVLIAIVLLVLVCVPAVFPATREAFGSLTTLAPFLVILLFAQAITAFATFALIGLMHMRGLFIASLISRFAFVVAIAALIFGGRLTVFNAALVHCISVVLNAGLLLTEMRTIVRTMSARTRANTWRRAFQHLADVLGQVRTFFTRPSLLRMFLITPVMLYGITIWGSDLLSTVLGKQPDIVMMRIFFGEQSKEIGFYHVACQMQLMAEYICLFGLWGALISVFSTLAHQDETEHSESGAATKISYPRLGRARTELIGIQMVLVLPLCTTLYALAPQLIEIIFGPHYAYSSVLLRWGLILLAFNLAIIGGGVHISSLVTVGKERTVFRYRLIWGAINLIANVFLIRAYGGLGALFGTQVSNIGACLTEAVIARGIFGPTPHLRIALEVGAITLVGATVSYGVANMLTMPLIATFAIAGLAGLLTCHAGFVLFRLEAAKSVYRRLAKLFEPALKNFFPAPNPQ